MYKNANKMLARCKTSTSNTRNLVTLARIKKNVSLTGSMVSTQHTLIPDDSNIQTTDTSSELGDDAMSLNKTKTASSIQSYLEDSTAYSSVSIRRSQPISEAEKKRLHSFCHKIKSTINEEQKFESSVEEENARRLLRLRGAAQKNDNLLNILETKVSSAIKNHGVKDLKVAKPNFVLSNRTMLPFYKLLDVENFLKLFQKADEDRR